MGCQIIVLFLYSKIILLRREKVREIGVQTEEIIIKTEGTDLGALVYHGGNKRLIIYFAPICLHSGWFKKALGEMAFAFEATIVAIDLPGVGLSDNKFVVNGRRGVINKLRSYCDFDLTVLSGKIQASLQWLKEKYQIERVYLFGSSLGGIIASYVLAEDKGEILDGVIFQAGFATSSEEIKRYVKPRVLKVPKRRYYPWLKKVFKGVPVFVFLHWSMPESQAVFRETRKTWRLLKRFLRDSNTVISFTTRTLESLMYAPEIRLPEDVPVLLIRSEKDSIPANQFLEESLKQQNCPQTIVLLKNAPHLFFDDEKITSKAIKIIQDWFRGIESDARD